MDIAYTIPKNDRLASFLVAIGVLKSPCTRDERFKATNKYHSVLSKNLKKLHDDATLSNDDWRKLAYDMTIKELIETA